MRKAKKLIKRFFKSILSFSILSLLTVDSNSQISKALEDKAFTKQPDMHVYVNKQVNDKGNVTCCESIYRWSYNNGKCSAEAMQDFDRNWLNRLNQQNSTVYQSLSGVAGWTYEKRYIDILKSMLEIQRNIIQRLNESYVKPWANIQPKKSFCKKNSRIEKKHNR
jgi:hypothetical protein